MFSILKKLFGKKAEEELLDGGVQGTGAISVENLPPSDSQNRPPPEAPIPPSIVPPAGGGEFIKLPLKPVLDQIPAPLKAQIKRPFFGEDHVLIPMRTVLAQLPRGRIQITFGEFKRSASADLFSNSTEHDQTSIDLPLREVFSSLGKRRFPRRTGQKQVEVSESILPLFGPGPQTPSPSAPLPNGAEPSPTPESMSAKIQLTPPACPSAAARPCASKQALAASSTESSLRLKAPASIGAVESFTRVPIGAPAVTAAAATRILPEADLPAEANGVLALPLAAMAPSLPDSVRGDLTQISLESSKLRLPLSEVEKALRRGKAAFSWRQLRAWIQPPLPPSREPTALEVAIELPLGIVAPEFLARRKPALAPQRNCEVAESIPNLFGLPAARPSNPASAVLDQAVLRTEQPAREVQTQSAGEPDVDSSPLAMATDLGAANANGRCPPPPAPAALPSPGLELGRIFDQPGKRSWTVSEIVRNTAQIQGVAGALLVTLDGLLIAAELPPGLAAETVAAFVPQMFSRVTQYATELGLGEPRHLTFSIEDTPLLIFKSGCVYFAVLGRARENLPGLQLRTIAAALPRPDRSS